ncbi:MAG TPA: Glu-tRNA(Gln) amidotransferase subunit GatE, partial [archaeon]|nr:Glu-tRNA(Gln) amidotransferase subunit GatE [archaeon]
MTTSYDYSKIGLKVGIEIHQQLKTAHKLFCLCKPELSMKDPEILFFRRLRPTQSELGQTDPAALFEFQRGRGVVYEADHETSCLVEFDESPPQDLNKEAVDVCLAVSIMMRAKPVDEIHVMRKTVIDGSNTTGFQRTAVIALNGEIDEDGKKVPIQTICLEEDAARKTGEEGEIIHYRIDRLGIPLIEVATAPVIKLPEEAAKVALTIGRILRATGKVKRGLGTIRQDINVSISDGNLIEIKGCQELELLPKIVEYEVQRQLSLIKIRESLRKRGVKKEEIKEDFTDVSLIFKESKSRVIKNALDRGGLVLAVKLPKFAGLLGTDVAPGVRFGTEMSERAVFWGRVGGIFHTDELPSYGITVEEVSRLKTLLKCDESDSAVFVADKPENATDALKAVVERAREALDGVPSETRGPKLDGTTRYERPKPGAARMYPETDIPPVPVTEDWIKKIKETSLELPEQKIERLMKQYNLNRKLTEQVMNSEYTDLFEEIAQKTKVAPSVIASILTETIKGLGRDGVAVNKLTDEQIKAAFMLIDEGATAKESLPEILTWLTQHAGEDLKNAVESLGLKAISTD